MTKLCSLALCIVISSVCNAQELAKQPKIKTAEDYDAAGAVKSIYEITYAAKLENRVLLDSTVRLDTVLFRHKETNILFNPEGYLISYKTDSFDSEAKTVLSKEERYNYHTNRISSIVYTVDSRITDSIIVDYDRHNKIDELIYYDRKGNMYKKVQYFYRNNNIFNIKVRDEKGLLVNFIRYKYNPAGKIYEEEINGSYMQHMHSYRYRYDTLKDGTAQVNKYDYTNKKKYRSLERTLIDKRGNITELVILDSNKRVTENHTMQYNPKNLLRSELVFTRFKNEYEYYYEYDDKGYWKTRYVVANGKLISKTHRVTEYYEEAGS